MTRIAFDDVGRIAEIELRRGDDSDIAVLLAELRRLRSPATKDAITAGEPVNKGELLVVDEETRIAYRHSTHGTVPGKVRIHGYAKHSAEVGEPVAIRHWFYDSDEEDDGTL